MPGNSPATLVAHAEAGIAILGTGARFPALGTDRRTFS
jgi:hypothetical protein